MGGLRSFVNWRTFLVGLMCGYVMAWCIHRVVMFKTVDGRWVEERVPYLTPSWGRILINECCVDLFRYVRN